MQPEDLDKLQVYHKLLLKWQRAINLVSNSTLEDAWPRHFEDSLQLLDLLPEGGQKLVDLGSGGGFPGMVLALARPDLDVHLIESDQRKCTFLQTVSRETSTPVTIHNARVEEVLSSDFKADIITARALADLSTLCSFLWPVFEQNDKAVAFLLKGRKAEEEIELARSGWNFDAVLSQSLTSPEGFILTLRGIRPVR